MHSEEMGVLAGVTCPAAPCLLAQCSRRSPCPASPVPYRVAMKQNSELLGITF